MNKPNTFKKGRVRVLIFKERGVWYGVALEFNIVESGSDLVLKTSVASYGHFFLLSNPLLT